MANSHDYQVLVDKDVSSSDQQELLMSQSLQSIRNYSTMTGVITGCIIQGATLGMNYVSLASGSRIADMSTLDMAILYGWSAMASLMNLLALLGLRGLLVSTFYASAGHLQKKPMDDDNDHGVEEFLDHLVTNTSHFFCIGSVAGLSGAWFLTDTLFGLPCAARGCLVVLLSSFAWYLIATAILKNKHFYDKEKHEREEHHYFLLPIVQCVSTPSIPC